MMPVSLPRLKVLSCLFAFMLTFSLVATVPVDGAAKKKSSSKAGKNSSSAARKGSKGKSQKSTARASSRRGSKSSKVASRSSRRGGKTLYARGRGGRKSRWRRQVATSSSSHGVGVHNYLSQAWTQPHASVERGAITTEPMAGTSSPSLAATGTEHKPGVDVAAAPASGSTSAPAGVTPAAEDVTRPRVLATEPGAVPMNPLVAAYADSLSTFGFSPESQGFIVTTMKGEVLAEHNADRLFNPASVTKIATSLTAISRLGPDFKFRTSLYTDGTLDPATGVLHGSLYVVGSGDPAFFPENAMMIADKLNRSGVREVDGNLVVLGQFFFSFSASREASAKAFRAVLSPETWSAQTKSSYPRFLAIRAAEDRMGDPANRVPPLSGPPSLKITGQTITDPVVNTAKLSPLAVHTSLPLLRVLKALNDFSNNWMATVIGNLVGGPDAVERFLKTEVGFKEDEC